ncbi:hypothetical protein [Streptomyces violarus]|uniref:Uncharacterized protein n=1 Tax=Streptomyces violarus TaxID=67380 RepID=A0A7W5F2E1_9ACTN|nr:MULTISPECIES: hypothetical protein [Streptomyces]MBB3077505.1 hypothetical protein [Streptomyces violarus]WRU00875.1 hypothetical protein VJ737_25775 [Streptomyces sp. CGMCC 4.1772]
MTGDLPSDGRVRDRRATQVFAGSDLQGTGHRLPAGTEILRGIPRQSEGGADSFVAGPGSRSAVRDPWQEPEEAVPSGHGRDSAGDIDDPAGHSHDPHEVTVQLDAVQLGDGFVRQVKEGPGAGSAAAVDSPVFVDESGRRSRRFRRIGMAVALACGVYAVVIVATLMSGNSQAPWLPVPGQKDAPPAGQVDSPPLPERSAPADGTGATAPGSTPATVEGTAPAPDASAGEPVAPAAPGRSATTAKPSPTPTRTAPAPGTGVTDPTPSKPADPPSTPVTDPTPPGEPTPEPTETTGTGDDGTGTVADGPAATQPVAQSPVAEPPVAEPPAADQPAA